MKVRGKLKSFKEKIQKKYDIADIIINKRKGIEIVFGILVVLSLFCSLFVDTNYDLSEYLPSNAPTKQGINLLKKEFGYPGSARAMAENVTLTEAKQIKNKIADLDGVDTVTWADSVTDVYQAREFINDNDIKDYYKNKYSVMDITFVEGDSSKRTSKALDQIKAIMGEHSHIIGSAVQNKSLNENLAKEIKSAMVICLGIIIVILILTTTSWIEPILFLAVMGIAIVINKGTNIFLGEVSFLTATVCSLLQLAVAMDYSIFLIHSFTDERKKGLDLTPAITNAIKHSANSILACGMATFFGFLALTLMKYRIGFDMGIVLAKGILISVLTVLILMPSLILRFSNLIEKTKHRSFVPPLNKFAKVIFNFRSFFIILAIIITVPAYVGKGMNDFQFGTSALGTGPGTKYYEDEQAINAQFDKSNMFLIIVPNTSMIQEKALSDRLEDLNYVKDAISLANTLPQGMPESFMPESITSQLHTKNYSRILLYAYTDDENKYSFKCSDEIKSLVKQYYPNDSYVLGSTPVTQDIKDVIVRDFELVDMLSIIAVAIVILITFRSLSIPIITIIPVEIAVFLNMLFPYLVGDKLVYMGYIIVSCLQLGATVDYAILMVNNYLDIRKHKDRKEATIEAIAFTTPPLLTSASILSGVGYSLYFTSSIGAIKAIGQLVGRGTLFSLFFVISLLPALLYMLDKPIMKSQNRKVNRQECKQNKPQVNQPNSSPEISI